MERMTVKRRIFLFNTLMVAAVLVIFLLANVVLLKLYFESVEQEVKAAAELISGEEGLKNFIRDFTLRRPSFLVLFLADGAICITGLVLVSQLFTKRLSACIMTPLSLLIDGAGRIRDNDLTQDIVYTGDAEFEAVCAAFNDMQHHILAEQEKNRRYEKARTDMIAGISHDLRTPLTAVRGTIKGLLDGVAATPQQRERFLQTAYRRTGDMDALLNQLFYLSRLETGKLPVSVQAVDIAAFVRSYVEAKRSLLEGDSQSGGGGSMRLSAETGDVDMRVRADPEQLTRILDNLLENSRKYAEAEPLHINVRLERTSNGVCLCVSDNGRGVPPEKLPYVFDEFYRGDESRNQTGGNGLGLYIVKYLTEAMGGSVRAESKDGFSVYVELRNAQVKE